MLEVSSWDRLERWGKGRQGTKSQKNKEEQDKGVERGKTTGQSRVEARGYERALPFLCLVIKTKRKFVTVDGCVCLGDARACTVCEGYLHQ